MNNSVSVGVRLLSTATAVLLLTACGSSAALPISAGIGPTPLLPEPQHSLIPLVNVGVAIYVWVLIAQKRSKPGWVGALMIIPGVDLFVLGFLAFSK